MRRPSPTQIFVGLMTVIVLLGAADRWRAENYSFVERKIRELDTFHERQLDLFVEQSQLLTTLTTGVLAALGAMVLKFDKEPPASGQWALLGAAVLAGFSLYFGYLAYQEVIWMLRAGFFNLESGPVAWPRRVQFFSFLASVSCGLYFVLEHVYNRPGASGSAHMSE